MRILWVKMGGLWPATTGGRVRSLNTISELARGHQVTVITTHGNGDDPDGLTQQLAGCEQVISVPYAVPKRGSAAFVSAVASSWFSHYPVDLWKWRVPEVRRVVRDVLASGDVDLCVADFLFAAANVPMAPRRDSGQAAGVPVLLFEHNVEYLIWQRLANLETTAWKRALFEMEWRKLRACEADACRRAALTVTVSDDDRRRLEELGAGIRAVPIPTGVDTRYFTPRRDAEVAGRLVFSGSMDWHPNEDAVCYFADEILPRIRADIPGASFTIVGRNPSARVRELAARPGIVVTGTLDDVRPSIAEGSVYVVPLRAGSGTRIKIFEALSMGKAVVSTSVGAEGLALESGRHFLAADTAHDFAQAVIRLLRDPARRRALGDAGRALVDANYSWSKVARQFETRCEEVVAEHAYAGREAIRGLDLSRAGSPRHRGARVVAGEQPAVGWSHHHP
ncbi:MAG TPA: glycosyltransferase family 4 protein [Vicinamibacterales bacterium]|nr:glycosyltransferase family 4 protein [Vicinamibacterales bacterium]